MILILHIVTSKNSSEDILQNVLFFFFNLINIYRRNICTELNLHYPTHITRHHSIYYITLLIGLDTSTYFLLILTVTF